MVQISKMSRILEFEDLLKQRSIWEMLKNYKLLKFTKNW